MENNLKEKQNQSWESLTDNSKDIIQRIYKDTEDPRLEEVYGKYNLTSTIIPQFEPGELVRVKPNVKTPELVGKLFKIHDFIRSNGIIFYDFNERLDLVIPEDGLEKYIPGQTLLEKYWSNGNIIVTNTRVIWFIWEDLAINVAGSLSKDYFDDSLNINRSPKEYVTAIYGPNKCTTSLDTLLKPNPENLLWERRKHVILE